MRLLLLVLWFLGYLGSATADEKFTVIYIDPASAPNSDYLIAELPSYYFMAGAPLQVSYRANSGSSIRTIRAGITQGYGGSDDLNCDQIAAPVYVGSNDPNRLDGDFDGWGCER